MPPSPALRHSPGRELRGETHKRWRSLEGGLNVQEKDDDLALFNEMQSKEREGFLLQSLDDAEDSFSTKLKYFSDFKLGISVPVRGETSELLDADEEKNDYEWLLTPPDTPLFPSLDDPPPANIARRGRPQTQPISISRSSTMDKSYRSSRGSASPNRLSPSPRSGSSTLQSRGRPSSAPQSSPIRQPTPTRRPSPSPSISSTPARRSSTPTPQRTSTGGRGTSPIRTSRGNSTSPKIRAWQSNIPGFSLDAPPNLRTSLADRPASYVRGSSPASRNGRDARFGRKSMSPTASRSVSSSHSHDRDQLSSYSKGSIASSGDDDVDTLQSIPPSGSTLSVSRRLGTYTNNKGPTFNKKSARVLSPSSAPKRSFDSALRQMDHRKSPPNMFRPLLSSVPSTTFYVGKGSSAHRSLMSKNSSVASCSNTNSDQGTSAVLDTEGSDQHDDMVSESGRGPYANVLEEFFAFDKMDGINQDASYERRNESLNILIKDADGDSAIQCDPDHSEELNHRSFEVEMSSNSDAMCDRGDLSEVDSFENTKICSKCGCRYRVIEQVEEEISLCTDCNRQHDIVAGDISDAENYPGLSMQISEGDKPFPELEASIPPSDSPLQVADAVEPWISQNEKNIKQSEILSQENSLGGSLEEGGEQRFGYQQEMAEPTVGYSIPGRDSGGQPLHYSDEHSGLKVNTSEVVGISVLLKRSGSSKGPVVLGRTFATIPSEDLSYARDSSNSFRSSVGHGSVSASSSVELGSSRQTDTHVQLNGRKFELENYRYDLNAKPQSFTLSQSSSNNYQALSLASSTNDENFEGSVSSLKFEEAEEIAVVSLAKASENSEVDSSFPAAAVPKTDGIEWSESSRVTDTLTSEPLEDNSAAPFPPNDNSVSYENGDNLSRNARIASSVEALATTLDPTLEEHGIRNDTPDRVGAVEAAGHSSLTTISEIEIDNSCRSSCSSELDGSSPISERKKKKSMDLSDAIPLDVDVTASVEEHNMSDHADGVLEESTVLVECRGGSKARSLTLEEATDTILFCNSIIHDLAYQAATIAIERESSVPLEGSRPTVTILGKSTSDRKDLRGRAVGRWTSKSHKVRQRRVETDVKSVPAKTVNDENAYEPSNRNVDIPNKMDSMNPPKLESKCNCSIM
ncbi:BASIC PROLINE-RICH PROTEIN5 [Hibiscus trionum]|uniref:BASIC PROLINE-RICH PROTEIN5 n=1 Tax=Hibiscus trionum TaxID=183268 RepID=A0A9W7MWY5_HIBTR|nr:BASIC PROLINE-RICH PROTEIN5 [Hibiscus trionum]